MSVYMLFVTWQTGGAEHPSCKTGNNYP